MNRTNDTWVQKVRGFSIIISRGPSRHVNLLSWHALLIEHPYIRKMLEGSGFSTHSIWADRFDQYYKNQWGLCPLVKTGAWAVVAGDPLIFTRSLGSQSKGSEENTAEALFLKQLFQDFGGRVCGYYFSKAFVSRAQSVLSARFQKLGVEPVVNLAEFSLEGYRRRDVRRAKNHGHRQQLTARELSRDEIVGHETLLLSSHKNWLDKKGFLKIRFLLGEPLLQNPKARVFVCIDQSDVIHSYTVWLPYLQGKAYYLDSMVRSTRTLNRHGVELCMLEAIANFKKEVVREVSLGLCLGQDIKVDNLVAKAIKTQVALGWGYSSKGLTHFKRKFETHAHDRYLMLAENRALVSQSLALYRSSVTKN